MLDRICRRDVRGDGLGKALDLYFQGHAAPTAVRNRAAVVRDEILHLAAQRADQPLHVVSMGSGPAFELAQALGQLSTPDRSRLQCTLVDMDPRALDFGMHRLKPLLQNDDQLRPLRLNLARFPQMVSNAAPFPPADFLSCTGFFDYLPHEEAVRMLRAFQQMLRPEGKWIVFNFSEHNPSRAYMEWIGNWYLQYRSPDAMNELASQARVQDYSLDVEPAGVNLFLHGTKV
jgi:hypothetical protein